MLSGTEVSQALGQEGVIFDTVRMSMKKKKIARCNTCNEVLEGQPTCEIVTGWIQEWSRSLPPTGSIAVESLSSAENISM